MRNTRHVASGKRGSRTVLRLAREYQQVWKIYPNFQNNSYILQSHHSELFYLYSHTFSYFISTSEYVKYSNEWWSPELLVYI